jgi:gamma-glutamyltranspeptidase / glutathione hydrolase
MRKIHLFLLLVLSFLTHAQSIVGKGKAVDPYRYTIQKTQSFSKGAVVSAHPIASKVGAVILEQGGNAIDAAIATQLALAVVFPGAGNIGGGGMMVAKLKNGKTFMLDYRETAPAKASRDMYLDENGNAQSNLSQFGHLASGVPGTVRGLFASMKYAKLPFKALIQPAIDLAEKGSTLTKGDADNFNSEQDNFKKYNALAPVFVKEGGWKAGDTLVQKDLANTLKRIRDNGAAGFYEGETARLLTEEMKRGNGLITLDDLKNYKAKERKPVQFDYKGYTIISASPPSSGGILLWQMLKMVEKRPLASYGFETVKSVQLMTEVERRAFADRAEHLGDPDFWKVPVKEMTSEAYLTKRMADYDSTKAGKSTLIKAGIIESNQTTHISIIDQWGNMASVTTTLSGWYGSEIVVKGAGFLLNNEMDDFSAKPGAPNLFGAVGGDANAIVPGKRMLSSMAPTIVLKHNQPFMVVGTPGGTTIPTSVFQTIVDVIDFKMTPLDAVNKPKFHHQWLPDEIGVEKGFPEDVITQLRQMGYSVKLYSLPGYTVDEGIIGQVEVVKVTRGKLEAVADRRWDDTVAGY